MKLQKELSGVVAKEKAMSEKIAAYASELKEKGGYNDFETRLSMDVLRAVVGTRTICDWYTIYNCDDSHILTLAKAALKQVYACV